MPTAAPARASIADNVEAYPASPIFAVSGDDTLTGSAGNDEFVFAQPIGNDRVYDFDAPHDTIDLIGFGARRLSATWSIANDANGNAVVTLGERRDDHAGRGRCGRAVGRQLRVRRGAGSAAMPGR